MRRRVLVRRDQQSYAGRETGTSDLNEIMGRDLEWRVLIDSDSDRGDARL